MKRQPTIRKAITLTLLGAVLALSNGCAQLQFSPGKMFAKPGDAANSVDSEEMQFGIARLTERNGSPAEAKAAYLKLLKSNPEHQGALHRFGVMLVKEDQLAKSMKFLEEAVSVGEPTSELLGDLGYVYYLIGDFENAKVNLTGAHQLKPDDKRILNNLAIVVGLDGDLERSLELFRSAGSEAEAQTSFAFVQTRSGNMAGAMKSYHTALESDSDLKIAANGLIELHQKTTNLESAPEKIDRSTRLARKSANDLEGRLVGDIRSVERKRRPRADQYSSNRDAELSDEGSVMLVSYEEEERWQEEDHRPATRSQPKPKVQTYGKRFERDTRRIQRKERSVSAVQPLDDLDGYQKVIKIKPATKPDSESEELESTSPGTELQEMRTGIDSNDFKPIDYGDNSFAYPKRDRFTEKSTAVSPAPIEVHIYDKTR